jgi:CheY-like chemotaxis protein
MDQRLKVLIIDDDHDVLQVVRHALEAAGFEVRTCENAAEAELAVLAACGDYIITDHDMPGMDGLELTRRLRRNCPESVIIGMSGRDLKQEFLSAGANDFIRKPFTPYHLAMMLNGGERPS